MLTSKDFIDPKTVEIGTKKVIISRLPAFEAASLYDRIYVNKGIIPPEDKLILASRCALITDKGEVVLSMAQIINQYLTYQEFRDIVDKAYDINFLSSDDGSPSQG